MEHHHHHHHHGQIILRIGITVFALIALHFLPLKGLWRFTGYGAIYLLIGYDVITHGALGLMKGKMFTETFLMTLATLGAFALSLLTGSGDYFEAVAVMLFYQTGELLEHLAVDKATQNIKKLMDIRPDTAHMETENEVITLHPENVPVGSIVQVHPGEKIPLDGVVVEGISALNTMALTGETLPRDVEAGSQVLSGCINLQGLLRIRTEQNFHASTVSKILELARHAAEKKSRSENFIRRFARVYTPLVCLLALCVALLPPLVTLLIRGQFPFTLWLYRALTFLVISCPCALVIGVPLTFFAGMGGAGKQGILIKGADALEKLSRAKYTLMDKTGTLTRGQFAVTSVQPAEKKEEILRLAAHGECFSTHPIGRCLQKAYDGEICPEKVKDIQEIGGKGIRARVDGKEVLIGNEKMMKEAGFTGLYTVHNGTAVHVAADGKYLGCILLADLEKPEAKKTLEKMKEQGVKKIIMLTGDRQAAAQAVAERLNLDGYDADLMPGDKVEKLEQVLRNKEKKEQVLFVGDGINDAPVLTRADIGVAMGGMGSDAAMEAADVVLMKDDLMQLPKAMRIAAKTMGIVKQNIIFALGVKAAFLLLGAMGILSMGAAVFADVGVMVLCVLNALRAMK